MWIFSKLKMIAATILPFLKPYLMSAFEIAAKSAAKAVKVVALEYFDHSGPEKKEKALKLIKDELLKNGKDLSESLINHSIEKAYSVFKEKNLKLFAEDSIKKVNEIITNDNTAKLFNAVNLVKSRIDTAKTFKATTGEINMAIEQAIQDRC